MNSVNRLLEQSEMYHNGNAMSNMSTLPTPRGSITPVTTAKAFHPIEKTPPVSPGAQLTQVSHTQALNLLQDSQVAEESTVRKLTPVKIVEQLMDQSVCSPELGHTSAVCVATLLVPHSPDLIPRGH